VECDPLQSNGETPVCERPLINPHWHLSPPAIGAKCRKCRPKPAFTRPDDSFTMTGAISMKIAGATATWVHVLRLILLCMPVVTMVGCNRMSESWKEEVRLSDGRLIVVKRTAKGTITRDIATRATGWKPKVTTLRIAQVEGAANPPVWRSAHSGRLGLRAGFIDVVGRSHLHVVQHLVRHGSPNVAICAVHIGWRRSVACRAPAAGVGRQARESAELHSTDGRIGSDPGAVQGNALAPGLRPVQVDISVVENQLLARHASH